MFEPTTGSGSKAGSNNNSPVSNPEEFPAAEIKPKRQATTDSDGSSSNEVSPSESLGVPPANHAPNNDAESLKAGFIKTSENKANVTYTILLVGETGVGKSSFLELIANVVLGKDIDHCDFHILDHTNEQGGAGNQSQTNSARLYEVVSRNGVVVRILDTPGLADTRGIQQDELHMQSIATQIEKHVTSITAVIILANGTVPRVTVGTDYALSTLSAIFPPTLVHNICFMFTNVLGPLHWNFSRDTLPDVLKPAPQFLLNNPIALQKKYLKLKDNANTKKTGADFYNAVKSAEQNALDMLVELFDWLDSLEPQPTTGVVKKSRTSRPGLPTLALWRNKWKVGTLP